MREFIKDDSLQARASDGGKVQEDMCRDLQIFELTAVGGALDSGLKEKQ